MPAIPRSRIAREAGVAERGITIVVITHERDIAAWGTRTIDFKDGVVVSDRQHQPSMVSGVNWGNGAEHGAEDDDRGCFLPGCFSSVHDKAPPNGGAS